MRFFIHVLSVAVLAMGMAACTPPGGPAAEDRIEIEFWHGMGGAQGRSINEIADLFNQSQDRYRVAPIYQGNYNSLSQKIIASLYAGRNPVMAQMYPSWSARYLRYGYLKPMAEFIEADPDFGREDIADFYPVMIEENTLTHPETGEEILATLPFNKSVYVLYVNQTRMEALGWEEPPRTWEELMQLAVDMTEIPTGASTPSFYGFAARPFVEIFTVKAMAAGTNLMDEETGEIYVNTEEALEALRFIRRLVAGEVGGRKVGYVESDYLSNVFGSERIGMYISSTASFPFNDMAVGNQFVWRAYPVPTRGGQEGRTLMQGTNVGIFHGVPQEKQQGAWEFTKFLTSPEMTAKWGIDTGYMPVRQSAAEVPEFAEHLDRDVRYANAVSTLERAAFEPRVMYWESVRQVVTREVEAVLLGRTDPESAMTRAENAIKGIQQRTLAGG